MAVAASGSLPKDLQRIWRTTALHGYHVEYGYSCMGYEVNAALGVKMAEPSREVYALVGDGAFMVSHSELITSLQERSKINVILFDNMANGCINNLQLGHGMGSFFTEFRFRDNDAPQSAGAMIPVDFAKIAEGYGCKSYRVTTEEELRHALADAARQQASTLIDIKVLPKTMLHNYFSWWRVGNAQTAVDADIQAAARRENENIFMARQY
ncbi:thiamine pyrophosphate-dependent enzyme [Martelella alba]|uniref:thiamine pyrophosphate-dependent enzyme n=1 Tax=Martelella alba TaxID=2590451 RepID=UPI001E36DC0C|nr:thiamine pyrophosphate-dependent enzyme [Martelella alba]